MRPAVLVPVFCKRLQIKQGRPHDVLDIAPDTPPPVNAHWFDLASPWRRRALLPPNPPEWLHRLEIEFPPGRLTNPRGLGVAAQAPRPCWRRVEARHPDGSLARMTLLLPVGGPFERAFPRWVDVYYGGGEAQTEPAMEWDCRRRSVRGPYYEAEFDAMGVIRRLVFRSLDRDLVDGSPQGGMAPVWMTGGEVASPSPHVPTRFSIVPVETGDEKGRLVLTVEQKTESFTLSRRFVFGSSFLTVEFEAVLRRPLEFFSPLGIRHAEGSGYALAPDGRRSPVSGPSAVPLVCDGLETFPGYGFSSQTGCFVWGESPDGEAMPDRFVFLPEGEGPGLTALGYANREAGDRIAGRMRLLPVPFAGDSQLERAKQWRRLLQTPNRKAPRLEEEESVPVAVRTLGAKTPDTPQGIEVGGLRLSMVDPPQGQTAELGLRLESADGRRILGTPLLYGLENGKGEQTWTGPTTARADAGALFLGCETGGPDGARWRIQSRIVPRLLAGRVLYEEERRHVLLGPDATEARFRVDVETPCGPPTWDEGEATVFIPGQMARGNYRPGKPHGGGPKWGPTATPALCPDCKPKDAPGHADQWMFSASRLPNAWAVAADRAVGTLAFLASLPHSPGLGETSVGFRSPARGTTTLRLAAPITYEPWLPHGYGRFSHHPVRETRTVAPGEEIVWRIYYGGHDTESLNDWNEYDQALYGLAAPCRPDAYKMSHEQALRLTCNALHTHFYKPECRVLSYGTGPDAQFAPIGFTGMAHGALALLLGGTHLGEEHWREAGLTVLDEIAGAFLDGPGFPFTAWEPETGWKCGTGEPGYGILCALDNLLEAIGFEREGGRARAAWERAARRCCDAWLDAQSPEGAYPLKHPAMGAAEFPEADYEATNITVGVIGCLVVAAALFDEARYLDSAIRAAEFYAALLDAGKVWGGPGDIEALVNSEGPMFHLRSFVRLAARTNAPEHVASARAAAAWRLAYQFAHAWALDPGSPLYRQGWSGLGSEGASASNLHSVCFGAINVPDYHQARHLFGDAHWNERLADLADYATQQFGRFEGDLEVLGSGLGAESWWTSETRWGKGTIVIYREKPNLGFMSWTIGWAAYGLYHALRIQHQIENERTKPREKRPSGSRTADLETQASTDRLGAGTL